MVVTNLSPILQQVRSTIELHDRFILTTHVNPDGDGIGSELALAHALRQLGKQVAIMNHSVTPDNYRWLDPVNEIVHFSADRDAKRIRDAEVIFILDTNQPDRLRSLEPIVQQSTAIKVVIDHHLDPDGFANLYFIDTDATSTGEIVYRLLKDLPNIQFTQTIAENLYTAIMTDTGSFRYPRTDPEIHQIAAHLLECGVDPAQIFVNVYEQWTAGRMRLLGEVLDSMKTLYDGKLAYVVCTQRMFHETGTTEIETDNFTTYPMSIRGVVVGILFNELKNGVKISFRSKGDIPINELAKEFGGNGHLNAAGARLFDVQLEAVMQSVIEHAEKYIRKTS